MKARLAPAQGRLVRALDQWIAAGGDPPLLTIEEFESEPWASLTYTGERHHLAVRLTGTAAQIAQARRRLEELLDDPDLALGNRFVADLAISVGPRTQGDAPTVALAIEALVLDA